MRYLLCALSMLLTACPFDRPCEFTGDGCPPDGGYHWEDVRVGPDYVAEPAFEPMPAPAIESCPMGNCP